MTALAAVALPMTIITIVAGALAKVHVCLNEETGTDVDIFYGLKTVNWLYMVQWCGALVTVVAAARHSRFEVMLMWFVAIAYTPSTIAVVVSLLSYSNCVGQSEKVGYFLVDEDSLLFSALILSLVFLPTIVILLFIRRRAADLPIIIDSSSSSSPNSDGSLDCPPPYFDPELPKYTDVALVPAFGASSIV